jgi:thioredoxin reductase (NADPH)
MCTRLTSADSGEYLARAIIISTGASAQWLGLPSEQRLQGLGVSACATCDGFFFKKKGVIWNTEVIEVLGEDEVTGLRLRNVKTSEESILPVQGIFLAICHKPNTDLFKGLIDMDKAGVICRIKFRYLTHNASCISLFKMHKQCTFRVF